MRVCATRRPESVRERRAVFPHSCCLLRSPTPHREGLCSVSGCVARRASVALQPACVAPRRRFVSFPHHRTRKMYHITAFHAREILRPSILFIATCGGKFLLDTQYIAHPLARPKQIQQRAAGHLPPDAVQEFSIRYVCVPPALPLPRYRGEPADRFFCSPPCSRHAILPRIP